MRTFASPRRGYCASCDGLLIDRPVYHMDETYCCLGCAHNGPCSAPTRRTSPTTAWTTWACRSDRAPVAADPVAVPAADRAAERVGERSAERVASGSPSASSTVPGTRSARPSRGSGARCARRGAR